LLLLPAAGRAQQVLGGISLGMNLTQVDGDEYYGFHKVGLNVGPMVAVHFGKNRNWSASLELLYSQKGSYHRGAYDSTTFRLVQDYAEVPFLIHYTDKKIISGGVGVAYGRLINYKETTNQFFDSIFYYTNAISDNEFSIIGDLQIRLWYQLWANVRYQYSLVSNHTVQVTNPNYPLEPYTRQQYNNVISIRLTWYFNQAKLEKKARQGGN
jgi:hypothetical protein